MSPRRRLLRDPLLHFIAAGGLLFAAFHLGHGSATTAVDDKTIAVDRSKLLTFMQYESGAFQPQYFNATFDYLTPAGRQDLVNRYVREEALYREATALGLANGDYVIRRRMVQKLLYLLDDAATESFAPTQAQLRAYYLQHADRYEVAPSLTFTHVFVDKDIGRPTGGRQLAEHLKEELQRRHARFGDAPAYGDRFPYLQNYVGRDPGFIQNEFGAEFAAALMKLEPSDRIWRGPIKSQFGYHIVLLTERKSAHLPELSSVLDQVRSDLLRDTIAAHREAAVADLVKRFDVRLTGISLSADVQRAANAVAGQVQ